MQILVLIWVELVNIIYILTSNEVKDLIMNFKALAIIAEFDDIFYDALGLDTTKELLTYPAYDDLYNYKNYLKFCQKQDCEAFPLD